MPTSDHVHFVSPRTSTKAKFDSGYMDEAGTATCQRERWGQRFDNNYSAQSLPCSETQLFGPEFTLIGDTLSMKELFESVGTLRIQGPTDAYGPAMAIAAASILVYYHAPLRSNG